MKLMIVLNPFFAESIIIHFCLLPGFLKHQKGKGKTW